MKKIYLAGPITGCNWGESEDWRDEFKAIDLPGIQSFSPLRGKNYLINEGEIKDHYIGHHMSTSKAIMVRDSFDVRTCDAVVVNFQGAKRVSIGTVMEIAWAWDRNKPVIAIYDIENEGQRDIHDHSMLNEAISWKVTSVQDAAEIIRLLFNP